MEEDRKATNLGPGISEILETEITSAPKQPKRRFVGRRAAEKAAPATTPNGSIEESAAIQGVKSPCSH
jgi:2-(3-amino-3-carboxypropyl)histidine synthase